MRTIASPMAAAPWAAALCLATPVAAQDAETGPAEQSERGAEPIILEDSEEQEGGGDRFSFYAGAGLVTEYISRGIAFSDKVSLQPYAMLSIDLPELTGGPITGAYAYVGTWNSMQFQEPGYGQSSSGSLSGWYETDLYAGAELEFDNRWTVAATYYRYESPSNSYRGYDDFEVIVGYDDSGQWEGAFPGREFSLSPALRLVQESGRPGRKDALYIQPSLNPSIRLGDADSPWRLAVPLVAGFSDDYYIGKDGNPRTFGFFRTGIDVSGAPFTGALDGLTLNAGVDVWVPNSEVASGVAPVDVVGTIGLGWDF